MGNKSSKQNRESLIEDGLRKKYVKLFQYIKLFEETRGSSRAQFENSYEHEDDWQRYHFSMNKKELEVLVSSYDLSRWHGTTEQVLSIRSSNQEKASLAHKSVCSTTPDGAQTSLGWSKFVHPGDVPVLSEDFKVKEFVKLLQDDYRDEFRGCDTSETVLSRLVSREEIAEEDWSKIDLKIADCTQLRNYLDAAYSYNERLSLQKKLFQYSQNHDSELSELVCGFVHVRMWTNDKNLNGTRRKESNQDDSEMSIPDEEIAKPKTRTGKGKRGVSEKRKVGGNSDNVSAKTRYIVNGPLLELVVDCIRRDDDSVEVRPRCDATLRVNAGILEALLSAGANNQLESFLQQLVDNTKVDSLKPDLFVKVAREVKSCHWKASVKNSNDGDAHSPPADLDAVVVTEDAWCLYKRKVKTNEISSDARELAKGLEQGLAIPASIKSMFQVIQADGVNPHSSEDSAAIDLVSPLPTSSDQKKINKQLFLSKMPVVIVHGPPGTGKTHSIVNAAAAALSRNYKVLMTSSNSRALQAFLEKLPSGIQDLCIDFSSCVEGGTADVRRSLEKIQLLLLELQNTLEEKELEIETCKSEIKERKEELRTKVDQLKSRSESIRNLVRDVCFQRILEIMTTTFIRQKHLLDKVDLDNVLERCGAIEQFKRYKTQEKSTFTNETHSSSVPETARLPLTPDSSILRREQNKPPPVKTTKHHLIDELIQKGFRESEILNSDGSINKNFIQLLENATKLKELLASAKEKELKSLMDRLDWPVWRILQDDHRHLTTEIQRLESKLVSKTIIVEVYKNLTHENHSKLVELTQTLSKISNGAMASSNGISERSMYVRSDLEEAFKKVLKFWPFVVMTSNQVSQLVPYDHKFDLGIIDEASQSNCTALNIMIRCRQFLVVGDDKQVSPSQVAANGLGRTRELQMALPTMPSRKRLLPRYSFFDLIRTAFPQNVVFLREHFRSVPAIIHMSNSMYYNLLMIPLRSSNNEEPLILDLVKGVKSNDVNSAEANRIADYVYDRILTTAKGGDVKTIGIISMGGPQQCKELKSVVEKKIDPLRLLYGAETVDCHKLLYGEPSQFQGDERDVIYLSGVHSTLVNKDSEEKTQAIKVEINQEAERKWNVALTRAKDKVVLVLSYGPSDLKDCDIRRPILAFFCNKGAARVPEGRKKAYVTTVENPMLSSLKDTVKNLLVPSLRDSGYEVVENGGCIWGKALRIHFKGAEPGSCALILVENAGESENDWSRIVHEQESLERAGRSCLRIDYMTLCLQFHDVFHEVCAFLERNIRFPHLCSSVSKQNEDLCHVSEDSGAISPLTDSTDIPADVKRRGSPSLGSASKRAKQSPESISPQASNSSEPSPELCKAWRLHHENPEKLTRQGLRLLIGASQKGTKVPLNLSKTKLLEKWEREQAKEEFVELEARMNSADESGSKKRKFLEDSEEDD